MIWKNLKCKILLFIKLILNEIDIFFEWGLIKIILQLYKQTVLHDKMKL